MIFQPSFAPERLVEVARAAEAAGVDELWLWEDCFREGGISTAAIAIASTSRIRVGTGVLPMPLRNVALTAMEAATIERTFPGRLRLGVGHGVQEWMGQVGVRVASPLTLMREYVPALRSLLAGETVTVDGRYVHVDGVRLDWPPATAMPVLAAGEGPKTLTLTGEVADGTVLTAGTSLRMLAAARDRIAAGRPSTADEAHEVVVFLFAAFGSDARAVMEHEFDDWGLTDERRVAALGDDDTVADTVQALLDGGATTVVLQPRADEPDLLAFAEATGRVGRLLA